ncbi:hypothetical protein POTOM_028613 [Populus tomentosa]|uniref:Histone deacetylase domain-containing protein n=1 Tax=Populus tomentosa TaxID=118781 RepID=A0A8X7Z9C7_POPTO|nr:hypothetical protein POTOM_028613 [Populus tomentosa]
MAIVLEVLLLFRVPTFSEAFDFAKAVLHNDAVPAMGHNQESSADLCFHTMDVLICYGVFAPVKHSFLGHACLVFCGGHREKTKVDLRGFSPSFYCAPLAYLGSETQNGSSELSVFPYEAHPEFHLRVPAIVSALEKKELISKLVMPNRVHGLKRVSIIDFDVHHGNGTNDAFYDDPNIFNLRFKCHYSSRISAAGYTRTGKTDELGHGDGEGTSLNLPLQRGSGDIANRTIFDEVIVPSAQRFEPDIFLASAG